MDDLRERIIISLIALFSILILYTLIYQWAMATFEGEHRTFFQSLQTVVETLTTAGFGGDAASWQTDAMNIIVVAMNLSGVLLVFLAIPMFAVPLFRQVMDTRPPTTSELEDHVIICGHSLRDEVLSEELDAADISYLYVDANPDVIEGLIDENHPAIVGDVERVQTFHNANAEKARAVVADINDEKNPNIILSARRVNPDIEVLSVVRDTTLSSYHTYAGADEVIESPRVLGESLAMRAVSSFAEKFREALEVDDGPSVTELLIEEDSQLVGKTLEEIAIFDRLGITVIGGWFGGKFVISPTAETVLEPNTILLVAGTYEDVSEIRARRLPPHLDERSRVIVCGYGAVGHAVTNTLDTEGNDYDVIDVNPDTDPDTIGDITNPETIASLDPQSARAIVLVLDDDTTTIFSTLIIKQLVPEVEVIARVHDPDNVWKLYNAGADFVLSMSVITGEMLASKLLDDRDILTPQVEFEFARLETPALVGQSLADAHIRARTGCTVVGIERGEELQTELRADTIIEAGDTLIVSGNEDAIRKFKAIAT